ncbi:hypothetical protein WGM54_13970 [Paenibacillus polymyxa]|uniref:hypothetical protein n=1 Tax=Paenibacillus polymyxa TaxID=1406 RepID=UPI00307D8EF4
MDNSKYLKEIMVQLKHSHEYPWILTTKGFNKVSNRKVKSYVQLLDMFWIDIVKTLNKFEELFAYLCKEYSEFIKTNQSGNIHRFVKWSGYFTYELIDQIGLNALREQCNYKKKKTYSKEDLKVNIQDIRNKLNRPPLYNEFEKMSAIPIGTYANVFKLKISIYDQVIKISFPDEYDAYIENKKLHKSSVGKKTGSLSRKIEDKELEEEFKKVFDTAYKKYDAYPSKLTFNNLSKYHERTYRQRLNKSWLEVCEHYGYTVDRKLHTSEKLLMNMIKDILGSDYESQKTWPWLIGVGGKHMYCDGYFPQYKLVIEFDGQQHRIPVDKFGGVKSFNRLKQNEIKKKELLYRNGIELIRIDSRDPWHSIDYLINILRKYITT